VNLTDTGAHFYEVYATSDDKLVAVGAIESQFYAQLLKGLGLDGADLPPQMDAASWPQMKRRFAQVFRTKSRAEWEQIFAGTDACVSPVLSPLETIGNAHMQARRSFAEIGAVTQPAPAPRFSRTPGEIARPPPLPGEHTVEALAAWGLSDARIRELREAGAIP
jgi:alpha-methylacyl-CoA racemase